MEIFQTAYGRFRVETERDKKFSALFRKNIYQHEEEIEFLLTFLNPQSVAVDVGAHIGSIAIPLAQKSKQVYAIEPVEESAELLKQNLLLNRIGNVQLHRCGLGDTMTTASAVIGNPKSTGTFMLREGTGIEVKTLDSLELGRVDLIKIDVEGMEAQVLKGGEKTISQWRPLIFFEVNLTALRLQGNALSSITKFFKRKGYNLYLKQGSRILKLPNLFFGAALLQPRMYFFGIHSGVFNVTALPREKKIHHLDALRSVLLLGYQLLKRTVGRLSPFRPTGG